MSLDRQPARPIQRAQIRARGERPAGEPFEAGKVAAVPEFVPAEPFVRLGENARFILHGGPDTAWRYGNPVPLKET